MNKQAILTHLQSDARTMQLATVNDGKPWIATVYFVADDELNLYWLSWPERRHSVELTESPEVAAAIVIKADVPVVGLQIAGLAEHITDGNIVKAMSNAYVKKYDAGREFFKRFSQGVNHHQMYRLMPSQIVLFDEVNNPNESLIWSR